MLAIFKNTDGQATVEAAVMIPVMFLLVLLLIQPGIYLYDLCIMNAAASETCRVLLTSNDEDKNKVCEPFARRRLSAIPQQDNFHLHSSGCSYKIDFEGNESSNELSVTIINQIKPLPIIGFFSGVFGLLNENGCFEICVKSSQELKPDWTNNSPQGNKAEKWVGTWLN